MAADVQITKLDVIKEYGSKLKKFRIAALACGVGIGVHIRRIQRSLENRKNTTQGKLSAAKMHKDGIVRRYAPIRQESLLGSDVAGDTDHQVEMLYQQLESMITDYNRDVDTISSKLSEIGQLTKTFCAVLDSETTACSGKLDEMISHMDEYANS